MTTDAADKLLSAIADPSRRRVLDLLVRNGDATASALAHDVPFTRQAVVKHLAVLETAGLVRREREGREVLFRVDARRLDETTRAMVALARDWDRRLASIKRIAEEAHRANRRGE